MILAKARLIEGRNGHLWIGLSFPTGFDPEEVLQETVMANENVLPAEMRCPPRRGTINDIYREFEVSFPPQAVSQEPGQAGTVRITGKFRRGLRFTASVNGLPANPPENH